ncbi:MAG: ABC transporter permease subunit [Bacillota bacterium]|nr:ABC transporter permease subunit [Bacillota bacterium]
MTETGIQTSGMQTTVINNAASKGGDNRNSFGKRLVKNYKQHRWIYYMALPVIIYYIVFKYLPMAGLVISFENYRPARGLFHSDWVGFKQFIDFFSSPFAWRIIRNTITINLQSLVFGFPAPIILALLLNEIQAQRYKSTLQTLSYLPHFISLVVVCGILRDFSTSTGLFNNMLAFFGVARSNLLDKVNLFQPLYVGSGVWQGIGWGSIIYLATLSGADPNLYEAAVIDGAGRFKQMVHVTFPTLVPIIVIQLIMQIGSLMSIGFEKVFLLYSPLIYEKADIISTYVYRAGIEDTNFSYGSAIGMFNSVVNLMLLVFANWLARKTTDESLW